MKNRAALIHFVISMLFVSGCGIRGTELSELTNVNYTNIVSIDYSSNYCQSYSKNMEKELFEEFFDSVNVKYKDSKQKDLECNDNATYRITLTESSCTMLIVYLSSGKLYCKYSNGDYAQYFLSISKVNLPLKFILQ